MIPSSSRVIIPDQLYFFVTSDEESIANRKKSSLHYFTCDDSFVFSAFFADFGPLDLGKTVSFCRQIDELLQNSYDSSNESAPCVYHCQNHPYRIANSAVLICAYMICCRNASVEEAYGPFIGIQPPLMPFRDAAFAINTFPCTVLDCCRALRKAVDLKHFSLSTFSVRAFAKLSRIENGDLSWIIPGKFIAFSGPVLKKRKLMGTSGAQYTLNPEEYVPILKGLGVTCIVRFNSKCYDKNIFTHAEFRHIDLLYDDGANPPEAVLQGFLRLCEEQRGVIAVHCKAGLGRTGTNISAFMMKHYGYTAKECVAWCRLCRPGCVVGPQQQFLISIESRMSADRQNYVNTEEVDKKKWKASPMKTSLSSIQTNDDRNSNPSLMVDVKKDLTTTQGNSGQTHRRPFTSTPQSFQLNYEGPNSHALPVLKSNSKGK